MDRRRRLRWGLSFLMLLALLVLGVVWSVNAGSLDLSHGQVLAILLGGGGENAPVVWDIRLPRVAAAVLLGGSLAVSCSRPSSPTPSPGPSSWGSPPGRRWRCPW